MVKERHEKQTNNSQRDTEVSSHSHHYAVQFSTTRALQAQRGKEQEQTAAGTKKEVPKNRHTISDTRERTCAGRVLRIRSKVTLRYSLSFWFHRKSMYSSAKSTHSGNFFRPTHATRHTPRIRSTTGRARTQSRGGQRYARSAHKRVPTTTQGGPGTS